MSAGSFSLRRLRMPWGAKKKSTGSKTPEKFESQAAIVPATSAENFMAPIPYQNLPETSQSVVPTKTDHVITTVKEVLTLAQSAASVTPVPFLADAIGVALKIIQVCDEASDVEQKVKELQDKVGDLMIVILNCVRLKDEEGSEETVVKEQDIEELHRILGSIDEDLTKISSQNRWMIAAYKQPNMNAIEKYMNRLSTVHSMYLTTTLWAGLLTLPFLQFANDLRDSALISKQYARLRKIADKVDGIDHKVNDMHYKVHNMHYKVDDTHYKVDNIHAYLFKLKRSGTRPVSDTLVRQEIPLKPEIFHEKDDMVEGIAKLLLHEETSRVCILGPGEMGKTSVSLAVVEFPLIEEQFPDGNVVWVPCIEATTANLLLDILYIRPRQPSTLPR